MNDANKKKGSNFTQYCEFCNTRIKPRINGNIKKRKKKNKLCFSLKNAFH